MPMAAPNSEVNKQREAIPPSRIQARTKIMKLYQSNGSPNSRRVRILIAEKGLEIELVSVDLGAKEQLSDAYRAINPRLVVPTLVLDDGTAIGEVPVIQRYLDDIYPEVPLFGATPEDRARIGMWDRRTEMEGFASVMEAIRNTVAGLKGRAIAGPHDYEQIPDLIDRSRQRVANFYADLDARLKAVAFVAGDHFSVADITALVTVDFATNAISMPLPANATSIKDWYQKVSTRSSASA
jgi:glutathione S-transferase